MLAKTILLGKISHRLGTKLGSGICVLVLVGDLPLNIQNHQFPNIFQPCNTQQIGGLKKKMY